jgi:hypothetical protein
MPVIVNHKDLSYLIAWLGMREVGALEPKPGLPPTSAHLGDGWLALAKSRPSRVHDAHRAGVGGAGARSPKHPDRIRAWLCGLCGGTRRLDAYRLPSGPTVVWVMTALSLAYGVLSRAMFEGNVSTTR